MFSFMSLFFVPTETAQPVWTPSGCKVHLSDYTVRRLKVSLLVHWLKIKKLFNAVSFDVLTEVKVKCSRYRPGVAQRVGRGIALLVRDRSTRRG